MRLRFDTDAGIGTRANLGCVVLETDETLEAEFRRLIPTDGVGLYTSRIPMVPEVGGDTLARMERDLPAAAALFPPGVSLDVVGFGCTSAATVIGPRRVHAAISSARAEAMATEPLSAVLAAAKALSVTDLGFVTPYAPEVSALMRERLEAAGLRVGAFGSFEQSDDRVVARITPAAILAAIESVAGAGRCEAVFVSCTNLRCLDIITEAETRTGIPVITSNQALAWHMMRLGGLDDAPALGGRLMQHALAA